MGLIIQLDPPGIDGRWPIWLAVVLAQDHDGQALLIAIVDPDFLPDLVLAAPGVALRPKIDEPLGANPPEKAYPER